jgi:DNA-binding transcriptional LysR family regulator
MELRQLKTFQTVAQELSFTRAAELLDYAQSSITAQIQALEQEIGAPLFERLGRRIVLTTNGEQLLRYAEKVLALVDEASQTLSGWEEPSGRLTISVPETLSTYRLPPLLREFRRRFPRVQLILKSVASQEVFQHLSDGASDVSVTLAEPLKPRELFQIQPLIREPLLLLAYPDHPLTHCAHVAHEDLQHETLLLTEARCTYRTLFERTLLAEGVILREAMEFGSVEAIKQCAMAGVGLSFLPEVAVQKELAAGQLISLNWPGNLHVMTQLIWHKDKWLSPALKGFIGLCEEIFGERRKEAV